ncbi:nuclear inhibitor of protein phosphatase [Medicago truncatula]|uniref:Nuclear inhibitor of protein phosphatase n=1 Tax=Medicago truncatula TaxID=3880 RepID=A0A072UFR9_MEDTR|nr:nuclear inhibitor of protein phosphatase [Medicago truncatula]
MKMKAAEEALEEKQKVKPSFELSGKLAAETNRVRGVTLLFNEPPEARKPDIKWRLYVFKTGEMLNEPLYIHRQSCYLFGRERRVADIPTDHPSCSKQHAVIQFRYFFNLPTPWGFLCLLVFKVFTRIDFIIFILIRQVEKFLHVKP